MGVAAATEAFTQAGQRLELRQVHPFERQDTLLQVGIPSRIGPQCAFAADDPVAWDQRRDRIFAERSAHGAHGLGKPISRATQA